jgi:hypothetical protein
VTLSWSPVPDAISYNIYFDRKPRLTKWNSHKIPNASSPITVTDLVPGTTYYFGIAVVRQDGESGILSEKSYTIKGETGSVHFDDSGSVSREVPSQNTVEPVSKDPAASEKKPAPDGQATISWDPMPNAVSYNIYWSDSPGVNRSNGSKIANATNPYSLRGLSRGKTYYFVVTAVNSTGESKESEEMSFTLKE